MATKDRLEMIAYSKMPVAPAQDARRHRLNRWVGVLAASLLAIGALAATVTPTADAWNQRGGCTGVQVGQFPIMSASKVFGQVEVFYDRSTGVNCAATISSQTEAGRPKYMDVEISLSNGGHRARDARTYRYYAGPVRVWAPHTCITVHGEIASGPLRGRGTVIYGATRTGWCA